MRSLLKITNPEHQESRSRTGKLVVFAGMEPGVGKALCTATIARRFARRWRCLAIELDNRNNLQTFLSLKPRGRKVPTSLADPATSLEHVKVKTAVPSLHFIGWTGGFPQIKRLLNSLRADPADYVFAALAASTSDESLDLFEAADLRVIVTHPDNSMEKIFEFLQHFARRRPVNTDVYFLLNYLRRGGEEKDTAAFVERIGANLGLKLSILGTAAYNPHLASGFQRGLDIGSFEDIALTVERLLPRMGSGPTVSQRMDIGKSRGRLRIFAAAMAPFGRKRRESEEKLRLRDELIANLQQRHESMIDDLQEMLQQKNNEIAEKSTLIDGLEDEIRRYAQQLLEGSKRAAELDATVAARNSELDRSLKQIRQIDEANVLLVQEKGTLIRENQIELHDLQEQILRLEQSNGTLLQEKTVLQLKNENIEAERDRVERRCQKELSAKSHYIDELTDHIRRVEDSNRLLSATRAEGETALRGLTEQLAEKTKCIKDLELRLFTQQDSLGQFHSKMQATIGRWHSLLSSMEAQTKAVVARTDDVILQKDAMIPRAEQVHQHELAGVHKLNGAKDTALQRLEDTLRVVETDNYQLKFDLMALMETTATPYGPELLLRERDTLVCMLRSDARPSATVIAIDEAGKDTLKFAIEMRSILESAGWNISFMSGSFEISRFYGLQIVKDGSAIGDSAARLLSHAFEQVGVPFVSKTAPTSKNLASIRLIIGQNNW